MAQVGTSAKLATKQDEMYPECRCDGQPVLLAEFETDSFVAPCPDNAAMCTQAECEAAYFGICPYCTDGTVAFSSNR